MPERMASHERHRNSSVGVCWCWPWGITAQEQQHWNNKGKKYTTEALENPSLQLECKVLELQVLVT